jgi:SAM-dependent methyltransferase
MNRKFLPLLCCPKTGKSLQLNIDRISPNGYIESGTLVTDDDKYQYPIINGIPRFVDKEYYSNSFGYEWNTWPKVQFESENLGGPMEGHTTKMFKTITRFSENELHGKSVIEFGCGPGRFLDVAKKMGGTAIGLDLSLAVEAARNNFKDDPDVLIVQGDILNPPFKEESFDLGYSIGVLHHTPNPRLGFENLSKVVKSGGQVACSVYGKKGFYDSPSVHLARFIHKIDTAVMGQRKAVKIAKKYSAFSAKMLSPIFSRLRNSSRGCSILVGVITRNFIVVVFIPDEKWRILDTFDAITPYYASTHSSDEVRGWYTEMNYEGIIQTNWGTTSFVGKKQKHPD